MLKWLEVLKAILEGKKSYGVALLGLIVAIAEANGWLNLDLSVGEQVGVWLGSIATLTMRAAVAKLEKKLSTRW